MQKLFGQPIADIEPFFHKNIAAIIVLHNPGDLTLTVVLICSAVKSTAGLHEVVALVAICLHPVANQSARRIVSILLSASKEKAAMKS